MKQKYPSLASAGLVIPIAKANGLYLPGESEARFGQKGGAMKPFLKLVCMVATALAMTATSVSHASVIFDFESDTAGNKGASHAISQSGIDLTITRQGGADVEVASRTSYPASWGSLALSPFLNDTGDAFLLTFSVPISSISVDVGDFQPSDDDTFSLSSGIFSDSGFQNGSTGFPTFSTLSLAGLNTTTAILSGGSANSLQSVFWDNITINAANATVPEPVANVLLGAGMLMIGVIARRRSTRK